jgi:SAM-dependent methyltransferase
MGGVAADPFAYYGELASSSARHDALLASLQAVLPYRGAWGRPVDEWLDNLYDSVPQRELYEHLAPVVPGGVVVQMGGTGKEALKALLGGARFAYHVTPVRAEAALTMRLAASLGLLSSLCVIVGVGERLPLASSSIDAYVSERCLHHTSVDLALREAQRVLRPGGRFAAIDQWHARLHGLVRATVDRQPPSAACVPLSASRLSTLASVFPSSSVRLHGALVRYPVIALLRLGVPLRRGLITRLTDWDDRVSAPFDVLRRNGSGVAILATA